MNVPGGCLKPPYSTSHVALSSSFFGETVKSGTQQKIVPSVFFRAVTHPCCARKRVMRSRCFPSQLLHLIDQHLNA